MRDKCILRLFMALPICLLLGCCMEISVQAGNVTAPEKTQTATACRDIPPGEDQEITLGFAGDVNLDENWRYMTVTSSESQTQDNVPESYLQYAMKGLDSLSPEMQAHHLVNIQMMKLRTMSLKEGS